MVVEPTASDAHPPQGGQPATAVSQLGEASASQLAAVGSAGSGAGVQVTAAGSGLQPQPRSLQDALVSDTLWCVHMFSWFHNLSHILHCSHYCVA